jgi:SagB-type dehydrogenase family enzyme
MPRGETATVLLHRLTSIERFDEDSESDPPVDDDRIVRDFTPQDMARAPLWFKRYDSSLIRVPLSRDLPTTTVSATAILAGSAAIPPAAPDLIALARILYLSAGVVRVAPWREGRLIPFRAAGSAGGRFPLELYLASPDGTDLPAGVYWYQPEEHALVRVGPAPDGGTPTLVITGVPWRTAWKYRERGYRHMYWDAGTMLSQLLTLADSAGIATRLYTRFPDAAVTELVGANGVHEYPLAVVALGDAEPALTSTGPAARGAVDDAPLEFPLLTAAQRAGDMVGLGSPWPRGAAVPTDPDSPSLDEVVLRRGSQRRMDPSGTVSRDLLVRSMAAALRGIDVPHWIAAHRVSGLDPGLYRWPDLDRCLRGGDLREVLYRICMDQALGRDASFVVLAAADVTALDDRQYREKQLAAGVAEGRLHLMAYAQNATASGMTFVDAEIPKFLGDQWAGLLLTCVGIAEYPSRPGGTPGRPVTIRVVRPRGE